VPIWVLLNFTFFQTLLKLNIFIGETGNSFIETFVEIQEFVLVCRVEEFTTLRQSTISDSWMSRDSRVAIKGRSVFNSY
jgi:hypothetical protein